MKSTSKMITLSSHAIAVGFTETNHPACMIISVDALPEGGDLAIQAEHYLLEGDNLRLKGPAGNVVIENITQMCKDAANCKLPLIVINAAKQQEQRVEHLTDATPNIFLGARK